MATAKKPRQTKATVKKTNTKKPRTFRDADGKTNIEKYNESLKGEKIVHKTTTEWAELIKDREDARQDRNKAEDALKRESVRRVGYQKELGDVYRQLWNNRVGSFCFGISFGCIISFAITYF